MFQARHFTFIANAIKEMCDDIPGSPADFHRNRVARHFAKKLQATNPQFDRDRFLTACGVPEGER